MLQLNNLSSLKKKRKRVGRGGSRGSTSCRGHKGQKSRSGSHSLKPFFEGGQMPLPRRLPRRGFINAFKKEFKIFNLDQLESKFCAGETVSEQSLRDKGLVKGKIVYFVKILGNGSLSKSLTVHVQACSKSAVTAIEQVGGTIVK